MTHCFVFPFLHKIIITPSPGIQVSIQVTVDGVYYLSIPHGTNKHDYIHRH